MSGPSRFLVFSLGGEEYAVPLLTVKEVIAVPDLTPLPQTPPHFLGIMNLRGQVISVIDMRIKLGMKPTSTTETVVIICDIGPRGVGIVVDRVDSVFSIQESEIQPRPAFDGKKNSEYLTGVVQQDKRLILLLDIFKALDAQDKAALAQRAA